MYIKDDLILKMIYDIFKYAFENGDLSMQTGKIILQLLWAII